MQGLTHAQGTRLIFCCVVPSPDRKNANQDHLRTVRANTAERRQDYFSNGDQAGSDAKFGVGIGCSLRPVRSIEKSFGPSAPAACRKNMMTRPLGDQVGPS